MGKMLVGPNSFGRVGSSDPILLVEIRNLTKYYQRGGQIIPVLVDIDLDVRLGDYLATSRAAARSRSVASTSRAFPTQTLPRGVPRTSDSSSSSTI